MTDHLLRRLPSLLGWLGVTTLSLIVNFTMIAEHYVVLSRALDSLHGAPSPLTADPILGWLILRFLPAMTLTHATALCIAVAHWLAFLLVAKLMLELFDCVRLGFEAAWHGRLAEVRKLRARSLTTLCLLACCLVPLYQLLCWDLLLARAHLASANRPAASHPSTNVPTPAAEDSSEETHAVDTDTAVRGYLAATILACLAFELSLIRTRRALARFLSPPNRRSGPGLDGDCPDPSTSPAR